MLKTITHYEQVPLAVIAKIIGREEKQKKTDKAIRDGSQTKREYPAISGESENGGKS
jgi:hypothetical protein